MHKKLLSGLLSILIVAPLSLPANGVFAANEQADLNEQISSASLTKMEQIIQSDLARAKSPKLHMDLANTGSGNTTVIVELTELPVSVQEGVSSVAKKKFTESMRADAARKIEEQQQTFEKGLKTKGIQGHVLSHYSHAINAVALTLSASQINDLLQLDLVQGVYPNLTYQLNPSEDTPDAEADLDPNGKNALLADSVPWIGANSIWDLGYQGEGIKVGVIDTGIDYLHPDLKDAYKGGYDFIDNDNDPYETTYSDWKSTDPLPEDFITSHGTHVAGIIASRGEKSGVKGVAPKADIYAYRVLGPGGTGSSVQVLSGINKAVEDKMDVINLSVGSPLNLEDTIDSIAINNAVLAGVVSVVAAGNAGGARGTLDDPGTSPFAITVANATSQIGLITGSPKGDFTIANSPNGLTDVSYNLKVMAWNYNLDTETIQGKHDVMLAGYGAAADFNDKDFTGKIALIQRGASAGSSITFADKIANARKAGAIGTIIYNNLAGYINSSLGKNPTYIPSFDMTQAEGTALAAQLQNGATAQVDFSGFKITLSGTGDTISNSSSRGPVLNSYDLKPEVAAPGTSIYSTVPAYGKDVLNANYDTAYGTMSGTSMATPHVAGLAALLKETHSDWTPFDVKIALMNNAKQLNTTSYDLFAQGAGRVQALETFNTEALARVYDRTTYGTQTKENITGRVNFGRFTSSEGKTIVKEIEVTNLTSSLSNYSVTLNTFKPVQGVEVKVDQSSFTLNDKVILKLTLTVPEGLTSNTELQGYLKMSNGATTLSVPYFAIFNQMTTLYGFKYVTIDQNNLATNEKGFIDPTSGQAATTNVNYELSFTGANFTKVEVQLMDVLHPDSGDGEGTIGDLPQLTGPFAANIKKTFAWDGKYIDDATQRLTVVPDGVYKLQFYATRSSTATEYYTWTDTFIIKGKAPAIVLPASNQVKEAADSKLSGSIQDLYVDAVAPLKKYWATDFILDHALESHYQVLNKDENVVKEGTLQVAQDGTFQASLEGVNKGSYTVKIDVSDRSGNKGTKTVQLEIVNTESGSTNPTNPTIPTVPSGPTTPADPDPTLPTGPSAPAGSDPTTPSGSAPVGSIPTGKPGSSDSGTVIPVNGALPTKADVKGSVIGVTASPGDKGLLSLDISAEDLTKATANAGNHVVTINVDLDQTDHTAQGVAINLPAPQVREAAQNGTSVVINTGLVTVSFKSDQLKQLLSESNKQLQLSISNTAASVSDNKKIGGSTIYNLELSIDGNAVQAFTVKDSVTADISYTLKKGEDPDKVVVYSIEANGKLTVVKNGFYNSNAGTISFKLHSPGKYAVAYANVTFSDLSSAAWAKSSIEALAAREVVAGIDGTKFNPKGNVTRAEFVKMLLTALDLTDNSAVSATFSDVFEKSWYYQYAAAAEKLGIVSGKANGTFGGEEAITRQDMAVMLYRALEATKAVTPQSGAKTAFTDNAKIASYAQEAVAVLQQNGIINGFEDGRFNPLGHTMRSEAAAVIFNVLKR